MPNRGRGDGRNLQRARPDGPERLGGGGWWLRATPTERISESLGHVRTYLRCPCWGAPHGQGGHWPGTSSPPAPGSPICSEQGQPPCLTHMGGLLSAAPKMPVELPWKTACCHSSADSVPQRRSSTFLVGRGNQVLLWPPSHPGAGRRRHCEGQERTRGFFISWLTMEKITWSTEPAGL